MKRVVVLALMAAGLPALGFTAMAQQPEQVIAFLDKTGDGKCELGEYLAYHQPRFAQFDADKDGELNLPEFKESLQGESKKNARFLFDATNKEKGRYLTEGEFLGYHAWVFKTYVDTDKDGFMSAAEWAKIMGRG